ncbi:MAG: hypothetical protein KIT83_21590 [Bryobacterales bacterium]|nr:hypothetical protein [Bryobacterales bacterium]
MAYEVYYRGQSSNHHPARPGQYQMDYGDGLYLTSDKATADVYAQKRVLEKGGVKVITQVAINPGELGRVLDLTADARWAKFMNTPMVPGRNDTTPSMLMRMQQNNYAIFQQFLSQHKIDITQYDAVKGPELTHGGTQVAILHKKGAPSGLAEWIRARLQPVVAGTPGTSSAKVPISSRVGITVRSVGGGMVMLGLSILVSYLRSRIDKRWIEKGLREIEPEVAETLSKRIPQIADLIAKGKKAYANVTVEFRFRRESAAGVDFVDAVPHVKLMFVDVSGENINAEGVMKIDSGLGSVTKITPYIFSYEVTTPAEAVKVWKEYMEEWEWYENQMNRAPSAALREQQELFHQEIIQVFGKEADLVLKAWMWPKFKFKAKTA